VSAISFTAYGRAKPAGALKISPGKGGRPQLYHRDAAPLKDWKNSVTNAAANAMGGAQPWRGPVSVTASFYFNRPVAHYGTGRNAEKLKAAATAYPDNRSVGDSDKLARALLDSLSATVFLDDSQVAALHVLKLWADEGGARVEVSVRVLAALPDPSTSPFTMPELVEIGGEGY
jgi:Holliday junction resolvase RusA-like endonuclease